MNVIEGILRSNAKNYSKPHSIRLPYLTGQLVSDIDHLLSEVTKADSSLSQIISTLNSSIKTIESLDSKNVNHDKKHNNKERIIISPSRNKLSTPSSSVNILDKSHSNSPIKLKYRANNNHTTNIQKGFQDRISSGDGEHSKQKNELLVSNTDNKPKIEEKKFSIVTSHNISISNLPKRYSKLSTPVASHNTSTHHIDKIDEDDKNIHIREFTSNLASNDNRKSNEIKLSHQKETSTLSLNKMKIVDKGNSDVKEDEAKVSKNEGGRTKNHKELQMKIQEVKKPLTIENEQKVTNMTSINEKTTNNVKIHTKNTLRDDMNILHSEIEILSPNNLSKQFSTNTNAYYMISNNTFEYLNASSLSKDSESNDESHRVKGGRNTNKNNPIDGVLPVRFTSNHFAMKHSDVLGERYEGAEKRKVLKLDTREMEGVVGVQYIKFYSCDHNIVHVDVCVVYEDRRTSVVSAGSLSGRSDVDSIVDRMCVAQFDIDRDVQIETIYCQQLEQGAISVIKIASLNGEMLASSDETFIEGSVIRTFEVKQRSSIRHVEFLLSKDPVYRHRSEGVLSDPFVLMSVLFEFHKA